MRKIALDFLSRNSPDKGSFVYLDSGCGGARATPMRPFEDYLARGPNYTTKLLLVRNLRKLLT